MNLIYKAAIGVLSASLASFVGAQASHNWTSSDGTVWKSTAGDCWRDGNWTADTASPGCDGDLVPKAALAPTVNAAPSPASAPMAAPEPTPIIVAPAVVPAPAAVTKVNYATDTFFDFDKAILKPEGKAKLDDLVGKLKGIKLEVLIVVGHTDSIGSHDYNLKLSVSRSAAVRDYLVAKNIRKNDVYTEGRGKTQPIADNNTSDGRAKNRRVEIEVVGTRPN
jgi:OOP family OmpA-OmpF porin